MRASRKSPLYKTENHWHFSQRPWEARTVLSWVRYGCGLGLVDTTSRRVKAHLKRPFKAGIRLNKPASMPSTFDHEWSPLAPACRRSSSFMRRCSPTSSSGWIDRESVCCSAYASRSASAAPARGDGEDCSCRRSSRRWRTSSRFSCNRSARAKTSTWVRRLPLATGVQASCINFN